MNKARMLLIFAPSAHDPRYKNQTAIVDGSELSLKAHDLARVVVLAQGESTRDGIAMPKQTAVALRHRYHVTGSQFKVILLDDGRALLQSDREVGKDRLSSVIGRLSVTRRPAADDARSTGTPTASGKIVGDARLPSQPDKQLTPAQVVRIQMEALQHNDVPKPDSGIATTFAFASPENRRATGPLEHFTQIVKAPAYLPMLNCKRVTYDAIVVEGDKAQQRVHIVAANGSRITYIFMLSRQADGPYAGCWMNDGCVRDDSGTEDHRFDA